MKSSTVVFIFILHTLWFQIAVAQQNKTEQKNKPASINKEIANKTIEATTQNGRKVLLKSDGTWEFALTSSSEAKPILPESVSRALSEFAKIDGAIELGGLQYDDYKSMLISFKATVNQSKIDLPEDSLISELDIALDKYEGALMRWDLEKITVKLALLKHDNVEETLKKTKDIMNERYTFWRENSQSLKRANQFSSQYERR